MTDMHNPRAVRIAEGDALADRVRHALADFETEPGGSTTVVRSPLYGILPYRGVIIELSPGTAHALVTYLEHDRRPT